MTDLRDTKDLPPEVLAQLKSDRRNNISAMAMTALRDLGETATTDELIIAVWRRHGIVLKRSGLQNCLHYLQTRQRINRIYASTWQLVKP